MKNVTIKNNGKRIGVVSYDESKYSSRDFKLYKFGKCITYREIEDFYDAVVYIPYPNQTIRGIVSSYEEDYEKINYLVKKIKIKNNISELTPFKPIKLYGIPSNHLIMFGFTDNLNETNSKEFIEDIHEFINDNRKFIKRNAKNELAVDILNDEINDLNRLYQDYLEADLEVRNYLYPNLREGYINIIERFKKFSGKNFLSRRRIYPIL